MLSGSAIKSSSALVRRVITLMVFVVFSFLYLGQKITWTQGAGFALIAAGAFLVFRGGAPQGVHS